MRIYFGQAWLGRARQGKARQQRNPRRYGGAISRGGSLRVGPCPGVAPHCEPTTRAWRGIQAQFSGIGCALRGAALRGAARRGEPEWGRDGLHATQSGIWDNFTRRDKSVRARAWHCNNVTGDGNPGHFPKHQEATASRGATVDGMTGSV